VNTGCQVVPTNRRTVCGDVFAVRDACRSKTAYPNFRKVLASVLQGDLSKRKGLTYFRGLEPVGFAGALMTIKSPPRAIAHVNLPIGEIPACRFWSGLPSIEHVMES
jgi:hypothetical protein